MVVAAAWDPALQLAGRRVHAARPHFAAGVGCGLRACHACAAARRVHRRRRGGGMRASGAAASGHGQTHESV
eukprot:354625-Chlamydomonas_euryale.AAC.9